MRFREFATPNYSDEQLGLKQHSATRCPYGTARKCILTFEVIKRIRLARARRKLLQQQNAKEMKQVYWPDDLEEDKILPKISVMAKRALKRRSK